MVLNKIALLREWQLQPSETENLTLWEYDIWVEELQKELQAKAEQHEKESKQYEGLNKNAISNSSSSTSLRNIKGQLKLPKIPHIN